MRLPDSVIDGDISASLRCLVRLDICAVRGGGCGVDLSSDLAEIEDRSCYDWISRTVLHVRSVSSWAPVCIGPYSQANTVSDTIHLMLS
jgi:hypothetical protein